MSIDKDFLIKYKEVQQMLKKFKDEENKMRVKLADELLKHRRAGTHHFNFENIHVKGVKKYNISADAEVLAHHYDSMSAEEQSCFNYKPSFQSTMYKKLKDTHLVDECIVTKPAMPTFEITINLEEE